uniref:Ig-like domain-containing protein n=1 Tax=Panagrellus redivivus TaxID=6233 RepID=A0A7E4UPY0_PANRE
MNQRDAGDSARLALHGPTKLTEHMFITYGGLLVIFLQICQSQASAISADASLLLASRPDFGDEVTTVGTYTEVFCNHTHPAYCTTTLSSDNKNHTIARAVPLTNAAFLCPALDNQTDPAASISWFYMEPTTTNLIGTYTVATKSANTTWTADGSYTVLTDGGLLLTNVHRKLVERYVCIIHPANEEIEDDPTLHPDNYVLFRLDYSSWYSHTIFNSVFYGAIVTSMTLCGVTFLINLLWIVVQRGGLWFIRRHERESRVHAMMQAVEMYRQRQIQNLQETYARNANMVREHYHQQVEQIREAYTTQITRLRDYRQARMDNVTSHLENVRDHYNLQLTRMREYGSRHADQLMENYERQLNRVRTFSLQQRLKMIRQYNLKQRHVNRLFPNSNTAAQSEPEGPDFNVILDETFLSDTEPRLKRSVSTLSLPEFTLVDGQEQPILREVDRDRLRLKNAPHSVARMDSPGFPPRMEQQPSKPTTPLMPLSSIEEAPPIEPVTNVMRAAAEMQPLLERNGEHSSGEDTEK